MDRGEIARGVLWLGLLDDRKHALCALIHRRARDHAVRAGLLLRDPHAPDDAASAEPLPCLDQLGDGRSVAEHDVVAPEHRERLVADQRSRLQHRMTVAFGFLLHDDANGRELLRPLQELDVLLTELHRQASLEAFVRTEVRVETLLARGADDDDAPDASGRHLRYDELDDRRVDHRQELFRDRPADRQEACPQPSSWDHAVVDRAHAVRRDAHRCSTMTVKGAGWVVRTASPVTASSGGRRSPLESRSRVS